MHSYNILKYFSFIPPNASDEGKIKKTKKIETNTSFDQLDTLYVHFKVLYT